MERYFKLPAQSRRQIAIGGLLFLLAGIACAERPSFEVASVKLTQHAPDGEGTWRSHAAYEGKGRFEAVHASLFELIRYAYRVKEYQILGPGWLDSNEASYDIRAGCAPDTSASDARLMLQKLLSDRLGLKLHRETRSFPIYELKVAPKGLKMTVVAAAGGSNLGASPGTLTGRSVTMAFFAEWLSRETERPVIDKTGSGAAYDFTLQYAVRSDPNPDAPSLFTAVQEQLGLKLESVKAPLQVLVIDHAERIPTDN